MRLSLAVSAICCIFICNVAASASLHEAVYSNNYNQTKLLLDAGENINEKDSYGDTPLLIAAVREQDRIAHLLIEYGAEPDIFIAAALGLATTIKTFLEQGANIDSKSVDGDPLLHIAIAYNRVEAIELLVTHGADLNATDSDGKTPLMVACNNGDAPIAKLLIDRGANPLAIDDHGNTALHIAARNNNGIIAQLLIDAGVDVNAVDEDKITALHEAVRHQSLDIIRVLIQSGADINAKDQGGNTPLHEAADVCNLFAAQLILNAGAELNEVNEDQETPARMHVKSNDDEECAAVGKFLYSRGAKLDLMEAASLGITEEVRRLLDQGIDPDDGAGYFGSPILLAIDAEHINVVKLLLERNADMGFDGVSLVCYAMHGEQVELIELLIKHGADVNSDCNGTTVLNEAVENGHADIVQLLLDNGADANVRNEYDKTPPIITAAKHGYSDIIKLLIKHGADVNIEKRYPMYSTTPLMEAAKTRNLDAVRILIEHGAVIDFYSSILLNRLEDAKRLVDLRQDINDPIGDNRIPLHEAARLGFWGIVDLLIDRGADVNSSGINYDERTPLQVAIESGWKDVAQLLIERGATPDFFSALAMNQFDVAGQLIGQGTGISNSKKIRCEQLNSAIRMNRLDIVQFLLENGADIHCIDEIHGSPLHNAIIHNFLDAARMLLENGADLFADRAKSDIFDDMNHTYDFSNPELQNDMIRLLLEYGAPLDIYAAAHLDMAEEVKKTLNKESFDSDDLYTPLLIAAGKGNADVVRTLLDYGATITCTSSRVACEIYDSPLETAALNGHDEIVRILREHGAMHSIISASILGLDEEVRKIFLNEYKKIKEDCSSLSPVHLAAFFNNESTLKLLIEMGMHADCMDRWNELTPLHKAAINGASLSARILIDSGADVRTVERDFGETPLHKAVKNHNIETVSLLLESRSSINEPNLFGCTPLDIALSCNSITAMFLKQKGALPGESCYHYTIDCEQKHIED